MTDAPQDAALATPAKPVRLFGTVAPQTRDALHAIQENDFAGDLNAAVVYLAQLARGKGDLTQQSLQALGRLLPPLRPATQTLPGRSYRSPRAALGYEEEARELAAEVRETLQDLDGTAARIAQLLEGLFVGLVQAPAA
jgi:hypothetical protein